MFLLLLACTPAVHTVKLPPVASCRSKVLHQALPGVLVQDVKVLEGEIPIRPREDAVDLWLQSTERAQESVLVEYSAGPFSTRRRARIQIPRPPQPLLLPPEPNSWRLRFEGASLGEQALSRSDLLGLEKEVELLLQVCGDGGGCRSLAPNSSVWASADAVRSPSLRLRDKDLVFEQRLTPKVQATLQPGPNSVVLGDSTAELRVESVAHPSQSPEPLSLDAPLRQSLDRATSYPHAFVLHLDRPQRVNLALAGPKGQLTLDLHHCDGSPYRSASNAEKGVAVLQTTLEPGDWLIRAGLPAFGVGQSSYELLATSDSQSFENFVRGRGSD